MLEAAIVFEVPSFRMTCPLCGNLLLRAPCKYIEKWFKASKKSAKGNYFTYTVGVQVDLQTLCCQRTGLPGEVPSVFCQTWGHIRSVLQMNYTQYSDPRYAWLYLCGLLCTVLAHSSLKNMRLPFLVYALVFHTFNICQNPLHHITLCLQVRSCSGECGGPAGAN